MSLINRRGADSPRALSKEQSQRLARCAVAVGVLALMFAKPLLDLLRFAAQSDIYSHVFLVPFMVLYLIWQKRQGLLSLAWVPSRLAVFPVAMAMGVMAGYWVMRTSGWAPHHEDYLAVTILSFAACLVGVGLWFFGEQACRRAAFPLALLVFLAPFPTSVLNALEVFFQHASAEASYAMLTLAGVPVFREGLVMHLPTIVFQVAQECSGIRSSLVLFITSLLAGHLFLRSPWKKTALALAVVPLAILRNGFRIFTLGMLCVHVDPAMIKSPIHTRGGPLFFVLSLAPFFLFLWWLRKSESAGAEPKTVKRGN